MIAAVMQRDRAVARALLGGSPTSGPTTASIQRMEVTGTDGRGAGTLGSHRHGCLYPRDIPSAERRGEADERPYWDRRLSR